MVLGFSVVFFILRKFGWKVILQSLKEREKSIEEALQLADKAREEMAVLKADHENLLKEAIKMEYNFGMSHLYLGDIYMIMKKPELARKEYQIVLEISEDSLPEYSAELRRDKKAAIAALKKHFIGL